MLSVGCWMLAFPAWSADPTAIPTTGHAPPELGSFDRSMTSFLTDNEIPGAALAVVKDGRLVLERGYGWADLEGKAPARPTSLFRIASLSKPITAVAILQLVEKGRLGLDDTVLDLLDLEPHIAPGEALDSRVRQITVLQLLQHTAGFDRGVSYDPMFRSVEIATALNAIAPATAEQIIRYVLGRPLDFDPGARYAYSNVGYSMLGRVIEKLTGRDYDDHVRDSVLEPLGIRDMRIGRTLESERAAGEVKYYGPAETASAVVGEIGKPVPWAYGGWCIEAMDSHGGWIASAVDLARFARAFDQPDNGAVLGAESVRRMFARPDGAAGHTADGEPRSSYYGAGWMIREREITPASADSSAVKINMWHTGSLSGTAALLVRRHDGLRWVALLNRRTSSKHRHLGRALDRVVHEAANEVTSWPQGDLFEEYDRRRSARF